jgi:hypothetical protein
MTRPSASANWTEIRSGERERGNHTPTINRPGRHRKK